MLTKLAGKRRWSAAEARLVLVALERSGEPPEAFAARHGIRAGRLDRWSKPEADLAKTPTVRFAEVTLAPALTDNLASLRLEVTAEAVRILVLDPERCSPVWVAQLAIELRGGSRA
jgi:hypothetical protein